MCWSVPAATLQGPHVDARPAAPGMDRMRLADDGTRRPDQRLLFETHDGAVVVLSYDDALIRESRGFLDALAGGPATGFDDQYLRMVARFTWATAGTRGSRVPHPPPRLRTPSGCSTRPSRVIVDCRRPESPAAQARERWVGAGGAPDDGRAAVRHRPGAGGLVASSARTSSVVPASPRPGTVLVTVCSWFTGSVSLVASETTVTL